MEKERKKFLDEVIKTVKREGGVLELASFNFTSSDVEYLNINEISVTKITYARPGLLGEYTVFCQGARLERIDN